MRKRPAAKLNAPRVAVGAQELEQDRQQHQHGQHAGRLHEAPHALLGDGRGAGVGLGWIGGAHGPWPSISCGLVRLRRRRRCGVWAWRAARRRDCGRSRPRRPRPVAELEAARRRAVDLLGRHRALGRGGERDDGFLVDVVVAHLALEVALAHHDHAVGHAHHLGELGRDDQHGGAALREVVDDAVDLGFRADVDAAGRLVEDQHHRARLQQARQQALLLVAARQRAHRDLGPGDADLHGRDGVAAALQARPRSSTPARASLGQIIRLMLSLADMSSSTPSALRSSVR